MMGGRREYVDELLNELQDLTLDLHEVSERLQIVVERAKEQSNEVQDTIEKAVNGDA